MTRHHFGLAALGLVLLAGLVFHDPIRAAPLPVHQNSSLAAPSSSIGDAPARIVYPRGHYPQLQARGGVMHDIHSLLNVSRPLGFGHYVWDAAGVPPGQVWVRIDLATQMLSVFRGDDEIGTAVIIYGARDHPTPVGIFHILQKSQFYYSKTYDAPMPFAQRLTADGVAIHASHVRDRVASHGCIGLPLEFARLLFAVTSRGDEVDILPEHSGT